MVFLVFYFFVYERIVQILVWYFSKEYNNYNNKQQEQKVNIKVIIKRMQQRQKKVSQKKRQQFNDIFLINSNQANNEFDFQNIHDNHYHHGQQQQQVMIIGNTTNQRQQQQQQDFILVSSDHNVSSANQSHLQRQFEEIRFTSTECNLMDMDIQNQERVRSVLQLSPYEYEQFIDNRIIEIEMPQLITEGYIMSYKLYQIKTGVRVEQKHELVQQSQLNNDYSKQNQFSSQLQKQKQSSQKEHKRTEQVKQQYDTCVGRRFSDFQYLNELLVSNYGGYIIPLLPEKNFWAIINLEGRQYAENRTKSLVKYLNRLFTHKKLRNSLQLKGFLFEEDHQFSTKKGEYLQKNSHLEDKLMSLSTGAYEYGKALYNKFVGGGQRGRQEEEIRLNKNKLTKDDLVLSEYEIVVTELMRIMDDMKALVMVTLQQIRTVDDIRCLFSSSLTDSFNLPTSVQSSTVVSSSQQQFTSLNSFISTTDLQQEFEQISQFISSCYAAIQRRKSLRQQIQTLKQQEQSLIQKYKNSPRSIELDVVRSKLNRLNKMNETYAEELIKELESHVDEGKGMLKMFVVKFEKMRSKFFNIDNLQK